MNETTLGQCRLADVAALSAGDRWTLIFSRDLRHPPSKVWTAPDSRPEQQSDGPVAERHQRHRTCAGGELAARAGVAGHPRRRDSVIGRHRHGSHAQVPAFPPPSSAGPRWHLPSTILGKVHGTCSFYGRGITDRRGRRGAKEEPPCIRKQ